MTYVVPQAQVYQEVNLRAQAPIQQLPPHISGGHAKLIRYSEPDEKPDGALGQYNHSVDQEYLWPNRPAGAITDQSYTRLFIDDALLHYYNSADEGETVTSVANRTNQVRAAATSFADDGASFPHSDVFKDRGAKIGDVVRLRATVDAEQVELCTYIAGFEAETIAAEVDAADDDASNASAVSADQAIEKTDGDDNCIIADIDGGSTYDGLPSGKVSEVYTVRVIQGSTDGDATTAVLQVLSDSGTDDVSEVTPGAFGDATDIGTRGVAIVLDVEAASVSDCDDAAEEAGVSANDLIVGQEWQVTVSQNYSVPALTIGGAYTGAKDDTYIIEITRGKDGATPAQFKVRTTRGLDVSGPTSVTSAGVGITYAVGTKGLTGHFDSVSLAKGDKWYVPVVAASDGELQTLVLGHNLPEEVLANGATVVVVDLYIRKNIEVPANRTDEAPLTNWEQSATQISLKSGITAFDDSYTDDGEPVALNVHARCGYSNLFITVRYWLQDLIGKVTSIDSVGDMNALISGVTHPDNPLRYATLKALQNAGGKPVKVTAVCDPSVVDYWADVLSILDGRVGIYNLVPLTRNAAVWSLFEAHVETQSSPENARWRALWLNPSAQSTKAIIDETLSTDSEIVMAVIEDDPLTTGTQYTYLRVPARNGRFVTNGVEPGDIVRYQYTTDGFDGVSYTEYIVDAIVNEDTLRLVAGPDSPISVAEKVEVWRNLSTAEQADELAVSGGFNNRRVRYVWPDTIEADGFTVEGYFLCAALAGLSSGVVPHQGLTHLEINGFTSVPRTDNLFGREQQNIMAGGGVWIVTQDPRTGSIYTRHALTTGDYDNLADREESIVRNLDSISYFIFDILAPYIGVSNVADSTFDLLRAEMNGAIKFLGSLNFSQRLGSQLITGDIIEIRPHAVEKDRAVIALNLTLPAPLNNIECHLVLVA